MEETFEGSEKSFVDDIYSCLIIHLNVVFLLLLGLLFIFRQNLSKLFEILLFSLFLFKFNLILWLFGKFRVPFHLLDLFLPNTWCRNFINFL